MEFEYYMQKKYGTEEFIKLWFRMERILRRVISFEEMMEINKRMEDVVNENKTPKLR